MTKDSFLFTNFLGAIKDSLIKEGYTPKQTNHLLVAHLMEIVNDVVHENHDIDHYVMKPVYRFIINIHREENRKMESIAYLPQIQEKMAGNDYLVSYLEQELSSIETNESKEEPQHGG